MSREGLLSFFVLVTICATQPLSSASHVISHLVQNADKEHSRSTGTVTQITPIGQFLTFLRRFLWSKRRRSKRFPFTIPVKVYGRTPRNQPFRDETATMVVSLYGGLLNMKPRVKLGQKILIVNSFTEEERECRVVYVDSKQRGRQKVAVEFANADGDFWHVYSPHVPLKPAFTEGRSESKT